jgi:Transcriptional regulatory protein, C terminal
MASTNPSDGEWRSLPSSQSAAFPNVVQITYLDPLDPPYRPSVGHTNHPGPPASTGHDPAALDSLGASDMAESEQTIGYRFGSFVLDLEWGGLITADGTEMPLRPKSFALLCFLAENARRILSRDEIMMVLWPNLFVTENSIAQCIRDIRRALGPEACQILAWRPDGSQGSSHVRPCQEDWRL